MALQFRRGTASERSDANFVPVIAEPIYETDTNKLYIGDGSTAGGVLVGGVLKIEEVGDVVLSHEETFDANLYSITSEILLISFPANHTIEVSDQILIENSSVSSLDGTYTVIAVSANTVTVSKPGASDISQTVFTADVKKVVVDGSSLRWNSAINGWEDYFLGLNDLKNVDLTTPATTGQVLLFDGTNFTADDISFEVSSDTTPQLGGNLDVNGNYIVSTSDGNIEIAPDGTGQFKIRGNATGGSGKIILNCEQNTHGVTIQGPPHSASATYSLVLPSDIGTAGQSLITDGSGVLSWITPSSALNDLTDVNISSPADGQVLLYDATATEWIAGTPVSNLNDLADVNASSPTDGQVLIYDSAASQWSPGALPTQVTHTTFEFQSIFGLFPPDTIPSAEVLNSSNVGENNGTWYELTASNASQFLTGPSSSTYDPNLTGISYDATNNYFTVPQGRYTAAVEITYFLGNYTVYGSTSYPRAFNTFAYATDSSFNYFYSAYDGTPRSTYASRQSLDTEMNHHMTFNFVAENATTSDNHFFVQAYDNAQPEFFVLFSTVHFIRLGGI